MEEKNDGVISQNALLSRFVQHTLQSWRFLLLFSVPPLLWVIFAAPSGITRFIIALLCGLVGFCCWRLWLDTRYFSVISGENNTLAGEALFTLWRRAKLRTLSFAERQQGALKQFRCTLWLVGLLWAAWLVALL